MILVCYGTRPEVIKVAPVIKALQASNLPFKTVFTGQHRELYEDVKFMVPAPDYELDIMQNNQGINGVLALILNKLDLVIKKEKASMVIVQGDTSTVLASALCALNEVLVTLHRRENFINGKIEGMFKQIESLAETHPELKFIFPWTTDR